MSSIEGWLCRYDGPARLITWNLVSDTWYSPRLVPELSHEPDFLAYEDATGHHAGVVEIQLTLAADGSPRWSPDGNQADFGSLTLWPQARNRFVWLHDGHHMNLTPQTVAEGAYLPAPHEAGAPVLEEWVSKSGPV